MFEDSPLLCRTEAFPQTGEVIIDSLVLQSRFEPTRFILGNPNARNLVNSEFAKERNQARRNNSASVLYFRILVMDSHVVLKPLLDKIPEQRSAARFWHGLKV